MSKLYLLVTPFFTIPLCGIGQGQEGRDILTKIQYTMVYFPLFMLAVGHLIMIDTTKKSYYGILILFSVIQSLYQDKME